jgi:hypothetical protein
LATDLNQLGQVPKLQALAMAVLRSRLIVELDGLAVATEKVLKGKGTGTYDTLSQRSVILDGSPKSAHPGDMLRCLDMQLPGAAADPSCSMLPDMVRLPIFRYPQRQLHLLPQNAATESHVSQAASDSAADTDTMLENTAPSCAGAGDAVLHAAA